jgi:hypothetical protein
VWTHFYSGSIGLECLCSDLSLTIELNTIFWIAEKMICRDQASERRYFGSRNIAFWRAKPCKGGILLITMANTYSQISIHTRLWNILWRKLSSWVIRVRKCRPVGALCSSQMSPSTKIPPLQGSSLTLLIAFHLLNNPLWKGWNPGKSCPCREFAIRSHMELCSLDRTNSGMIPSHKNFW